MTTRTRPLGALPPLHAATNPYAFGVGRAVLAVFTSVVVMVASTGWFVYRGFASDLGSNAIDITGLGSQSSQALPQSDDGDAAPADSFAGRALNILLVGSDSRLNQDVGGIGDVEDEGGIRGDTTMLVHVSADRSRVQVVSIPRDLLTTIPSCTRTDGSVSGWVDEGMFNSAISIGANWGYDLASGIACTVSTTEYLTGLTIDGFAVVDFTGFRNMIDALGGVWFNFDEPVYDSYAQLDLPAGCQQLNGTQALAYARARHDLGDGSDTERMGRQQQLVSAILRELLGKNFVTDLPSVLSFIKQALSSLSTSPNLADINADAGLLLSVSSIDRANIQFLTMPSEPASWDPDRVTATEPDASNVWLALANDSTLPPGIQYTDGSGNVLVVPDPDDVVTAPDATGDTTAGTDAGADTAPQSAVSSGPTVVETTIQDQCPPAGQ